MNFSKRLVYLFFAVCLIGIIGCEGKDEKDATVPDPPGTIIANISKNSSDPYVRDYVRINTGDNLITVTWLRPDNIYAGAFHDSEICTVGSVSGLGNITTIPTLGYTTDVACEPGYGYVIRARADENSEYKYMRLYVVSSIENTYGGIMGATVKYQYPFEP